MTDRETFRRKAIKDLRLVVHEDERRKFQDQYPFLSAEIECLAIIDCDYDDQALIWLRKYSTFSESEEEQLVAIVELIRNGAKIQDLRDPVVRLLDEMRDG